MSWKLDDEQKEALLSFVRDDGKGLVVAHAALDANYKWPEYAEMIGGWFQATRGHVIDAPAIVEDPTFPAVQHFPRYLQLYDEMYYGGGVVARQGQRADAHGRDEARITVKPQIRREEHARGQGPGARVVQIYGKGRVLYSQAHWRAHQREAHGRIRSTPQDTTPEARGVRSRAGGRRATARRRHPKVKSTRRRTAAGAFAWKTGRDSLERRSRLTAASGVDLTQRARPERQGPDGGHRDRHPRQTWSTGSSGRIADCEFVAACDVRKTRLDAVMKEIGGNVQGYSDYRRILDRKDIDAVLVTTPDHWHGQWKA